MLLEIIAWTIAVKSYLENGAHALGTHSQLLIFFQVQCASFRTRCFLASKEVVVSLPPRVPKLLKPEG